MVNNRFVLYQVKREIKRNGTTMEFYRYTKNQFGEPGEPVLLCTYTGFYHEHAAHMLDTYKVLKADTPGRYRTEKSPQFIVPYKDFYFNSEDENGNIFVNSVEIGDMVNFNGRKWLVSGVLNVQEWNLLMDISFEECDFGGNTGKPESIG